MIEPVQPGAPIRADDFNRLVATVNALEARLGPPSAGTGAGNGLASSVAGGAAGVMAMLAGVGAAGGRMLLSRIATAATSSADKPADVTYTWQAVGRCEADGSTAVPTIRPVDQDGVLVPAAANDPCLVFLLPNDSGGTDVKLWAFTERCICGLFAVKVTQTGGSAGDASTACSFTYGVKDAAGNTIGAAMSPAKRRTAVGPYVAPSADAWGTAFRDTAGTLVLFDANEVPDVEVCE